MEYAARRRNESFGRYKYALQETLFLDPLPCWRHLPPEEVRQRVKELVDDIDREAAEKRRKKGRTSMGAKAVMKQRPHHRPDKLKKSDAPPFHAKRKWVRKMMWEAYAWVGAAHCEASEKLRAGDRLANFPEGTFPPGLPFVPFARGHPP